MHHSTPPSPSGKETTGKLGRKLPSRRDMQEAGGGSPPTAVHQLPKAAGCRHAAAPPSITITAAENAIPPCANIFAAVPMRAGRRVRQHVERHPAPHGAAGAPSGHRNDKPRDAYPCGRYRVRGGWCNAGVCCSCRLWHAAIMPQAAAFLCASSPGLRIAIDPLLPRSRAVREDAGVATVEADRRPVQAARTHAGGTRGGRAQRSPIPEAAWKPRELRRGRTCYSHSVAQK